MSGFRRRRHDFDSGFSLGRFLSAPFRKLTSPLANAQRRRDSFGGRGHHDRGFFGSLVYLLTWPLTALGQFALFLLTAWASSRSGRAFLLGLPAVLAAGALVGGCVLLYYRSDTMIFRRYYGAVFYRALERENYALAELATRRAVHYDPSNVGAKLAYARALFLNEKREEAFQVLSEFAPPDAPGTLEAQQLFVDLVSIDKTDQRSDKERKEALEPHLRQILAAEPTNEHASRLLGTLCDERGQTDEAIQYYLISTAQVPLLAPRLAQLLMERNETERANFVVARAHKQFPRFILGRENDPGWWELWMRTHLAVEDFRAAEQVAQLALRSVTTQAAQMRVRRGVAQVCDQYAARFTEIESAEDYSRLFRVLCHAMQVYPVDPNILSRLLDLTVLNTYGLADDQAWLDQASLGVPAPFVPHLMSAIRCIQKGDEEAALAHLSVAHESDPTVAAPVWGELANVLIDRDEPQTELAMTMLDIGIRQWPDDPRVRGVRGHHLKFAERWEEAAADLEMAVEKLPTSVSIREALIECYDQLGEVEKSRVHRQAIEDDKLRRAEERTDKGS
jgi:tetratricopeptide (TPR) repeat protein